MIDRVAELEAELAALRETTRRLEEVTRASRRVLFHVRSRHSRLVSDCELCGFELGQLDRTLARLDQERR